MSGHRDYCLPAELVETAARVIDANRAAGRRIAVAESCTGGLVFAALTEIAGSSDVFEAGFVTYSNEAKIGVLDVSEEVIETFGSVSIAAATCSPPRAAPPVPQVAPQEVEPRLAAGLLDHPQQRPDSASRLPLVRRAA